MAGFSLLKLLAAGLSVSFGAVAGTVSPRGSDALPACKEVESKISSGSRMIWPVQAASFASAINHWYYSSTQVPTCVVEVGSIKDLSTVLQIVGTSRTPFAVKSGGHASNPGFSSTKGVHISLKRLNQIILSGDGKTVEVGFGNHWTDVFKALEPTGYNVVGGRTPGPGVGGFTVGGGYSWKTNQFGLTCDTVKSYDLVLPNGTFAKVSADRYPDLFFALKGGMNRFGVVTSAVFDTHPQPPLIYGGIRFYGPSAVPALINATSRFFYENTDPKAQMITTLEGSPTGTTAIGIFFYDGPEKPAGFNVFDDITPLANMVRTQPFASFVQGIPAPISQLRNPRGGFITMSTSEISQKFVEAVKAEVDAVGQEMALHTGTVASFDIEPFTKYGEYATDSAYPHDGSPIPLNLYFAWALASEDEWWYARMHQAIDTIKAAASEEGIYTDAEAFPAYPNYALFDDPVEELHGPTNAARLRVLRQKYDPNRVMGLAGGFDI